MPPHRFGEDLGDGVLLPKVAFDVHLHPQQNVRRTEGQEENTVLYPTNGSVYTGSLCFGHSTRNRTPFNQSFYHRRVYSQPAFKV